MLNPIRAIVRSKSPRGVKVIALSLLLVFVCAAPIMLYTYLSVGQGNSALFGWLFAIGAVVAHIGFLAGMLLIIWDMYFSRK